jgi:tetratricopeptide (TPR) repeat protein
MNDYKTAEQVYLEGIRRNPKETLLHYDLGVMYYRLGNYEEAKKQVTEEMKINEANFMMYYLMGGIYKMEKRPEEAAMMWEHTVSLNPTFTDAYRELIKYYSEKKDTLNFLRVKKELEKQGFQFVKGAKKKLLSLRLEQPLWADRIGE